MNKSIKTPATVQELFRTARELDMMPSELIGLFDDALGNDWAESDPQEVTLRDVPEDWNPDNDNRPASGIVPPGFNPWDADWAFFKGKEMKGERWIIESEWTLETGEFGLTFWAHDDDAMSADETREYAKALLEMSSYITTMENIMNTGVEGTK